MPLANHIGFTISLPRVARGGRGRPSVVATDFPPGFVEDIAALTTARQAQPGNSYHQHSYIQHQARLQSELEFTAIADSVFGRSGRSPREVARAVAEIDMEATNKKFEQLQAG